MSFFKKIFGKKEAEKSTKESFVSPEKSFVEIKALVYPYFKQLTTSTGSTEPFPSDLPQVDKMTTYEMPGVSLVILNVCEDLNCLYAINSEYGLEIIQESHLVKWGISKERLHEIALENFRSLIATNMTARGDTNGIMFTIDGNLEAGLVLIDEIWEQLEEQIGEPVVISVPSRDVIVATGKSNRPMIEAFTQNSKDILMTGDHPLSKYWFIRQGGKWNVFEKIIS
jgi:uncharacterized protein YtpQ (UPF0354 family)